jgi:hypothetical protein
MARRGRGGKADDAAAEACAAGLALVRAHPLYGALLEHARVCRHERSLCPSDGWAVVVDSGWIEAHPTRRGAPEEWARVLAHCLLHLAFDHFQEMPRAQEWNAA